MNSIKHILQRKVMQQKMLESKHVSKQSVSKYILSQRKIPEDVWKAWERILKVPKQWFVDEKGYCRNLTEEEVLDLNELMDEDETDFGDDDLPGMDYWVQMLDYAAWMRSIRYRTGKVKNALSDAIYTIPTDVIDQEEVMCRYESNLKFYETVMDIQKSDLIADNEWNSIFKALRCLGEPDRALDRLEGDELACDIYNLLKSGRDKKAKQDAEVLNACVELWGSDVINMKDEGKE